LSEFLFCFLQMQLRKMEKKQQKEIYEYCAQIEKKADIIEKTVEEQRDIEDRKHEATDIIISSMTSKMDLIERKLEKYLHEQVLLSRKIESLSSDFKSAPVRNSK